MADDAHRHRNRSLRGVPDSRWTSFGDNTTTMRTTRSDVLNAFIAWYIREPGAKLPKRPEPPAE